MTTTYDMDAFASWVEDLMRKRGYDIDSPRGGGKSRIADEAGVHRAAVTRLLQRQSMPDLETTRRLARVLGVPVRDMLIRSGRLTAEELPLPASSHGARPGTAAGGGEPEGEDEGDGHDGSAGHAAQPPTLEELAEVLGVPADRRDMFVKVVGQFLPGETDAERDGIRAGKPVVSD